MGRLHHLNEKAKERVGFNLNLPGWNLFPRNNQPQHGDSPSVICAARARLTIMLSRKKMRLLCATTCSEVAVVFH